MSPTLAHIAGFPVEETVAMAAPILGATCVALMASLSGARQRRASRRDRRRAAGSEPGEPPTPSS